MVKLRLAVLDPPVSSSRRLERVKCMALLWYTGAVLAGCPSLRHFMSRVGRG